MKKILLSFLFLLMMCAGLSAGGMSLSLSTGLLVPVTQFNADDTGWNENENFPGMMSDASYKVDMAFDNPVHSLCWRLCFLQGRQLFIGACNKAVSRR